jgi:hypothetical protein
MFCGIKICKFLIKYELYKNKKHKGCSDSYLLLFLYFLKNAIYHDLNLIKYYYIKSYMYKHKSIS